MNKPNFYANVTIMGQNNFMKTFDYFIYLILS